MAEECRRRSGVGEGGRGISEVAEDRPKWFKVAEEGPRESVLPEDSPRISEVSEESPRNLKTFEVDQNRAGEVR